MSWACTRAVLSKAMRAKTRNRCFFGKSLARRESTKTGLRKYLDRSYPSPRRASRRRADQLHPTGYRPSRWRDPRNRVAVLSAEWDYGAAGDSGTSPAWVPRVRKERRRSHCQPVTAPLRLADGQTQPGTHDRPAEALDVGCWRANAESWCRSTTSSTSLANSARCRRTSSRTWCRSLTPFRVARRHRPQIEELAFEGAMLTSDSGRETRGFRLDHSTHPAGALEARVPDLPAAPRSPLEAAPFLHAAVP
jgi:hypothetical protein